MEADKSQHLQGELGLQESQWHSSSPKDSRFETQEEPLCQFESKGRTKSMFQFKSSQAERILSYSELASVFVLFSPSTGWMRPAHISEGSLLYSVYEFQC